MHDDNRGVNHNAAVDNEIRKSVLLKLKDFEEEPYKYAQRKRQNAFDEKSDNRIVHYPRHHGICLTEIACVNQHLSAEPVGYIKKIQEEKLCAEPVLARLFLFAVIK